MLNSVLIRIWLTTFTGEVDSFPNNVDFIRILITLHPFLVFLPRNYPFLLLGRIVSYRETRGALRLPEFRADQLDFGGRERAPGEECSGGLIFEAAAADELAHDACRGDLFVADGDDVMEEPQQAMGFGILGTILGNGGEDDFGMGAEHGKLYVEG